MAEIAEIHRYPLAGAAPCRLEGTLVGPAGIRGDRLYMLYDPAKPEMPAPVGAGELPELPAVRVDAPLHEAWLRIFHPHKQPLLVLGYQFNRTGVVGEFDTPTPVHVAGQAVVNELEQRFGRPLGIARKVGGHDKPPADHAARALHIMGTATAAALRIEHPQTSLGKDHFGANIEVDGLEPGEELSWVGKVVKMGNLLVRVVEGTGPHKAVYGYPVNASEGHRWISLRDQVKVIGW